MMKKGELLKAKKLIKELCSICLEEKRRKNSSYCRKCASIKLEADRKRKREKGLCVSCLQPARKGKSQCEKHAKLSSEANMKQRYKGTNAKSCPTCGRWSAKLDMLIEETKNRMAPEAPGPYSGDTMIHDGPKGRVEMRVEATRDSIGKGNPLYAEGQIPCQGKPGDPR